MHDDVTLQALGYSRVMPAMRFIEYDVGGFIRPHTDGVMFDKVNFVFYFYLFIYLFFVFMGVMVDRECVACVYMRACVCMCMYV
jgi:hypothetical protein